jgi:hypothetical protein
MLVFFKEEVLKHTSPYFKNLLPHLELLHGAIFPPKSTSPEADRVHGSTNCEELIKIFKTILLDDVLIKEAEQPKSDLGKRSQAECEESDLDLGDAIGPSKRQLLGRPTTRTSNSQKREKKRKATLMTKGQGNRRG